MIPLMGQRMYCNQWHPDDDAKADQWCEEYHRPELPRSAEDERVLRDAYRQAYGDDESRWDIT